MTGYEVLEYELSKKFSKAKIASNRDFIESIISILANEDGKTALSLAEKKEKEAEQKMLEAERKFEEARTLIAKYSTEQHNLQAWKRDLEKEKAELVKDREAYFDVKEQIEKCETEEARDKIRLATFFMDNTRGTSDGTTYTRGLSNILGNGRTSPVSETETARVARRI